MNQKTTWILVTDASRARLFAGQKKNQPWELLQTLTHPESREREQDLVTDRPGHNQQSGSYHHSRMEPPTSPKEIEHGLFAKELAHLLEKGLQNHSYHNLLIVAAPRFLGMLRDALGEQVKKHIHTTIDKDYTHLSNADLQERLDETWKYV